VGLGRALGWIRVPVVQARDVGRDSERGDVIGVDADDWESDDEGDEDVEMKGNFAAWYLAATVAFSVL
jgi:hypothetical protein